ncbi:MAG: hypothetical protein H6581_11170 [Bacteroidia bacterium]|nr:hypothetical protein [Bacteroidia bacterium]
MKRNISLFLLLVSLAAAGCLPKLETPTISAGEMDLSRLVMVGGDYLAGYQDGALSLESQQNSVGNLLGRQLLLTNGQEFNMPWMPAGEGLGLNSRPTPTTPFQTRGRFGLKMACDSSTSNSVLRENFDFGDATAYLAPGNFSGLHNYSVPFMTLEEMGDPDFGLPMGSGSNNPYFHRFASNPGNNHLLTDVLQEDPTFVVFWNGMEEIYRYAYRGATGPTPPSVTSFAANLNGYLFNLTSNGAKGVVANIPSLHSLPFFRTIPYNPVPLDSLLADSLTNTYQTFGIDITYHEGENGLVIFDPSAQGNYRLTQEGEYVCLNLPLDSVRCYGLGVIFTAVPDRYVLTSDEIAEIDTLISQYNDAIELFASQYSLPVVDVNGFLQNLQKGMMVDGVEFNTDFVSGGFFSLDGQNPSAKGSALLANEFIKTLNAYYNATIPPVQVDDYNHVLWP